MWLALLVPLLEQWYIKTEALSFLYDDMDIISINNWTGNTVSLLTFCGGVNTLARAVGKCWVKYISLDTAFNIDYIHSLVIFCKYEEGFAMKKTHRS